ncbi:MAG: CehA/McbA family metallohydrolase [Deltaproteobacteria bacterium]|jgi:hypothetical protein
MTSLLEVPGRVLATESKTVVPHAFDVPAGVDALELAFDYGPRRCVDVDVVRPLVRDAIETHLATCSPARRAEVEPRLEELESRITQSGLNNLLNVTLIDPSGVWRGRWDRNPSSASGTLTLSAEGASKGFIPGAIEAGRWTAVVEVHGVFGAPVDYQLRIDSGVARAPAPVATTDIEPGRPHRETWGDAGRRWFLGEMHSHSHHSDGAHEIVELAHRASRIGLDFLCITDHNATSGFAELDDLPITIVRGSELTTFFGHAPIYGLDRTEPWHEDGAVLPFATVARRARDRGAIVSVAHPFKLGDPLCTGCRMTSDYAPDDVNAMEVWYRTWDGADWDNRAAYAAWNAAWAAGHRLTAVAARDWHGPAQETPFPGDAPFTAILADDASEASILAGLRAGRVIMTGGPLLTLDLEDATIGDVVEHRPGRRFTCRVEGRDRGSHLTVYRNNEKFFMTPVVENGTTIVSGEVTPGWYRAELWLDGAPRAITNHVVVE